MWRRVLFLRQIALAMVVIIVVSACSRSQDITSSLVSKVSTEQFTTIDWSPDASKIVATGKHYPPTGDSYLYFVDVETGKSDLVSETPRDYSFLSWSPDGSKVAMTVSLDSIWILEVDTNQIGFLTEGEGAVWFPDGERLAVYVGPSWSRGTDHREIRITDLEGNIHRSFEVGEAIPEFDQVSSGDLDSVLKPMEYLSGISMAPNGENLIFSLDTYANREERWESYVVNINDGSIHPFLPDDPVRGVSWSPDSINIAYIRGQRIREGELFISDSNGICRFRLELPPEFSSPTWSLNTSKIMFLYDGYIHLCDVSTNLQGTNHETGCP